MVKERAIHTFFIGLSVITFPFIGSISGIKYLGWLGREVSFYPLFIGSFIWLFQIIYKKGVIRIPYTKSYLCLICFVAVIFLSGCANCRELMEITFGGNNGLYIFFMQFNSILVYVFISTYVYNWLRMGTMHENISLFYKWIIISFIIAGGYSVVEIGRMFGNDFFTQLILVIDEMFRPEKNGIEVLENYGRIRSVAAEASYFGMYTGIVFPWLLSLTFFVQDKRNCYLAFLYTYFIILIVFSVSRTAYFIFALQAVTYFLLFRKQFNKIYRNIISTVGLLIICFFMFSEVADAKFNVDIVSVFESLLGGDSGGFSSSNDARLGSQYAALLVFSNSPLLGVGFGIAGIYLVDYYPLWSLYNWEIHTWTENVVTQTGLPSSHGLYSRLLAETGVGGFFVWITFLLSMLVPLYKRMKNEENLKVKIIQKNFLVTLIGIILFAFNVDAFRLMPYWITFAFVWYMVDVN